LLTAECFQYHSHVSSFGERLRRQREMRGISLEQIVTTTKISRRLLQALEDEQFELLPGGIFNKSYVKAYAKCVGLNEDEAVADYLEASQESPPDTRTIAHQHASLHSERHPEPSSFPFIPVLVLVAVVAGGVGGWKLYQEHKRDREVLAQSASSDTAAPAASISKPAPDNKPQAAQTSLQTTPEKPQSSAPPPAASPTPVPATSSSAAPSGAVSQAGADAVPGTPFQVIIRPKDRAWVSVKSDGVFVVRGIIRPPDVKTINARNEVVFYTGNAGAVDVAFQGKDVPVTGGPNQEAVLVFNSHGLLPKVSPHE
jgi:cytoskeleton protein RodZ